MVPYIKIVSQAKNGFGTKSVLSKKFSAIRTKLQARGLCSIDFSLNG